MDQYIIHHIKGIVTFQPGCRCYWDDATLYRLLAEFKREMIRQRDYVLYEAADQYQDVLLARI